VSRLQIVLSRRGASGQRAVLQPSGGRFWRIKAVLIAVLVAGTVIGLSLAALLLGSVIAAVLIILVSVAAVLAGIKALVRYLRNT